MPVGLDARSHKNLSHALSKILRHTALSMGLQLDSAGYASVEELLALPAMQRLRPAPSLQHLQYTAAVCPKQRFGLRNDGGVYMIRANQGHNAALAPRLDAEALLQPLRLDDPHMQLPSHCVHGTTLAAWQAICSSGGLHPMGRSHIHFSARDFGAADVVSGMRPSSQVLIHVDIARCLRWAESSHVRARALHLTFFRSANDVLLTSGVQGLGSLLPSFLFERVEELLHGRGQGHKPAQAQRSEMASWTRPTEEEWMAKHDGQARASAQAAAAAPAVVSSSEAVDSVSRPAVSSSPDAFAAPATAFVSSSSSRWGPPATSRPPPGWVVPEHLKHVAQQVAAEHARAQQQQRQPAHSKPLTAATDAAGRRSQGHPVHAQ